MNQLYNFSTKNYTENFNWICLFKPQASAPLSRSCFRYNRDPDNVSALALLDLIDVFDTADHHILMQSPKNIAGLPGHVLDWFKYFMSWRLFLVWGVCVFLMLLITYDWSHQGTCWLCGSILYIYSHQGVSVHSETMFIFVWVQTPLCVLLCVFTSPRPRSILLQPYKFNVVNFGFF